MNIDTFIEYVEQRFRVKDSKYLAKFIRDTTSKYAGDVLDAEDYVLQLMREKWTSPEQQEILKSVTERLREGRV